MRDDAVVKTSRQLQFLQQHHQRLQQNRHFLLQHHQQLQTRHQSEQEVEQEEHHEKHQDNSLHERKGGVEERTAAAVERQTTSTGNVIVSSRHHHQLRRSYDVVSPSSSFTPAAASSSSVLLRDRHLRPHQREKRHALFMANEADNDWDDDDDSGQDVLMKDCYQRHSQTHVLHQQTSHLDQPQQGKHHYRRRHLHRNTHRPSLEEEYGTPFNPQTPYSTPVKCPSSSFPGVSIAASTSSSISTRNQYNEWSQKRRTKKQTSLSSSNRHERNSLRVSSASSSNSSSFTPHERSSVSRKVFLKEVQGDYSEDDKEYDDPYCPSNVMTTIEMMMRSKENAPFEKEEYLTVFLPSGSSSLSNTNNITSQMQTQGNLNKPSSTSSPRVKEGIHSKVFLPSQQSSSRTNNITSSRILYTQGNSYKPSFTSFVSSSPSTQIEGRGRNTKGINCNYNRDTFTRSSREKIAPAQVSQDMIMSSTSSSSTGFTRNRSTNTVKNTAVFDRKTHKTTKSAMLATRRKDSGSSSSCSTSPVSSSPSLSSSSSSSHQRTRIKTNPWIRSPWMTPRQSIDSDPREGEEEKGDSSPSTDSGCSLNRLMEASIQIYSQEKSSHHPAPPSSLTITRRKITPSQNSAFDVVNNNKNYNLNVNDNDDSRRSNISGVTSSSTSFLENHLDNHNNRTSNVLRLPSINYNDILSDITRFTDLNDSMNLNDKMLNLSITNNKHRQDQQQEQQEDSDEMMTPMDCRKSTSSGISSSQSIMDNASCVVSTDDVDLDSSGTESNRNSSIFSSDESNRNSFATDIDAVLAFMKSRESVMTSSSSSSSLVLLPPPPDQSYSENMLQDFLSNLVSCKSDPNGNQEVCNENTSTSRLVMAPMISASRVTNDSLMKMKEEQESQRKSLTSETNVSNASTSRSVSAGRRYYCSLWNKKRLNPVMSDRSDLGNNFNRRKLRLNEQWVSTATDEMTPSWN